MVPIWIKNGNARKPACPVYYTLAANGFFITKETPYWKATVPVKKISILEDAAPSFELLLPPMEEFVTRTMAHFFAWIYRKYGTEAAMLLWFNYEEKKYRVDVPLQRASAGSVEYVFPKRDTYLPYEILIGTFHSHGGMGAFHSGVDVEDEFSFDGIHGTFGGFSMGGFNLMSNQNSFELSVQGVVNGHRLAMKPEEFLRGLVSRKPMIQRFELAHGHELLPENYSPPKDWQENFTKKTWREYADTFPPPCAEENTLGEIAGEKNADVLKPIQKPRGPGEQT